MMSGVVAAVGELCTMHHFVSTIMRKVSELPDYILRCWPVETPSSLTYSDVSYACSPCLSQIMYHTDCMLQWFVLAHSRWTTHHMHTCRDAKRSTKRSPKPSNFNFLTNQSPATEILTNGITWREIPFCFWTNQRKIKSLLASFEIFFWQCLC